jgi:protein-S-isoprenylcysteine O-methyltransferase Ste14
MERTEGAKVPWRIMLRYLVGTTLSLFMHACLIFGAAGRIDIPRAWVFLGATALFYAGMLTVLYRVNPTLLIHRAEWRRKKGTKRWDKFLVAAYITMQFVVQFIVIGLDVGRYHWSEMGVQWMVPGFALLFAAALVSTWAMAVNPHFEPMVRIQTDRGHRVITRGPYSYVRHPGYAGIMLWPVSTSLIMGSLYGLVPAVLCILILLVRTAWEDKTLFEELDGYAEYAERVRFRLIPGVW